MMIFDDGSDGIVTEVLGENFSGYRWILTSAKVHSSLMTVSLKRQFLLYMAA